MIISLFLGYLNLFSLIFLIFINNYLSFNIILRIIMKNTFIKLQTTGKIIKLKNINYKFNKSFL